MDPNLIFEGAEIIRNVAPRTGKRWRVTLLREGVSKNGWRYSRKLIQEAGSMFEGKWGHVDHPTDYEAAQRPGGSVANKAVFYEKVHVATDPDGRLRLDADMVVCKPDLRETMLEAWGAGRRDFAGLSINARASSFTPVTVDGRTVKDVNGFEFVRTVDLVSEPSAGGELRDVLESNHGGSSMPAPVVDPNATAQAAAEGLTPDQIRAMIDEAATSAANRANDAFRQSLIDAYEAENEADDEYDDDDDDAPAAPEADVTEGATASSGGGRNPNDISEAVQGVLSAAEERIANLEAELYLQRGRDLIEASLGAAEGLPTASVDRARETMTRLLEAGALTADDVPTMIQRERDFVAALNPVNPAGTPADLRTHQPVDNYRDALMATFDGAPVNGAQPFRSIKEAFISHPSNAGRYWPDVNAYEIMQALQQPYDSERDSRRIQEAVSTATFGNLFADVMHMRLLKVFADLPYSDWRKFATEVQSVSDFRTHNWVRMGQYDNIPTVGEGQPYGFLTTPGDEKASYSIAKYGGLEQLTLEAVANDYLTQLKRIPDAMAYASVRTLFESVMDTITTEGLTDVTTYDGLALYHATHANKSTKDLTVTGMNDTQVAMRLQKPYGAPSTEFLGPRNKITQIIVNPAMELRAKALLSPSTRFGASNTPIYNGATPVRQMDAYNGLDPYAFAESGIGVTVYDKLSAAGNNNWFATANPSLVDMLVVGFFNGRQAPELFVQDLGNNNGAAFTADKITYKVRMFWGVGVLDHRGVYCNELA
ncbi:MAG: hypothetical protein IPG34_20040 [Rhodocyclaceae bacterium]|nr:hypothetical protein [Rhodocyclaceae bacterium]